MLIELSSMCHAVENESSKLMPDNHDPVDHLDSRSRTRMPCVLWRMGLPSLG
jgi:hypothetical protein